MKAYSQDVRQRVLRAADQGTSQAEIANTFAISTATIKRYLKQRRETGHVFPKAIPGRPAKKGAALQAGLKEQLERYPDATREEHCRLWEEQTGIKVSPASISRARADLGWTRKKTIRASEQNEAERSTWRTQATSLTSTDLVFVDETGSPIAMTPLYTSAPRGQRALGKVPHNYGTIMTLIASLSMQGMGEAFLLDAAADSTAFAVYVEQVLAPSLRPGQIVILDNLSIHLGPRVKQAIETRGCRLLFLPAYAPDFSPLEEAFSKLKSFLRRVDARSREDLQEAIATALDLITTQDALGWFIHCGYPPPSSSEMDQ